MSNSYACIGGGKVDIGFKRDSSGNVIVSLKLDSGKAKEILDDTGFLSMNLAAVHLVKAARAAFFKKTVGAAPDYPAAGLAKVNAAQDDLVTTAEKPKFEGSELEINLNRLTNAMYETKLNITAAVRDAGDTAWQPERLYRELGLPEAGLTRSLAGCNAATAFNPNIGAMPTARADADAMPSFSVK